MKIAVINLVRSKDRRQLMERNLGRLGLEFEFFSGVDGSRGEHEAISRYDEEAAWRDHLQPLTIGEIGCFASHYRLWQRCARTGEPIIIMEDDVIVTDTFVGVVEAVSELISKFALLRLALVAIPANFASVLCLPLDLELASYQLGTAGTQCYAISPAAAKALVEHAAVWSLPVDLYLERSDIHGVPNHAIRPFRVRHADQEIIPTVIGNNRWGPKPKRPTRLAVAKLPDAHDGNRGKVRNCGARSPVETAVVTAGAATKLSLVICTRNRSAQLGRCLESVKALRCAEKWELVVVDDGSTDDTQTIIEKFRRDSACSVISVFEPKPGTGLSRNRGWRAAHGEIVAFTDDDCYPAADFLENVLKLFEEDGSLGFVGGRILLHDPTDYRITVLESATHIDMPPKSFIPAGAIQGANFSFRRSAIESVHGFDDSFGPGTLFPCEDIDIVTRISAAGWWGAYDPGPVVYHHHGRKTDAARCLGKQYDRARGAYYAKTLLNPALSSAALRHWARQVRLQPIKTTKRELLGACRYWMRLSLSKLTGPCVASSALESSDNPSSLGNGRDTLRNSAT